VRRPLGGRQRLPAWHHKRCTLRAAAAGRPAHPTSWSQRQQRARPGWRPAARDAASARDCVGGIGVILWAGLLTAELAAQTALLSAEEPPPAPPSLTLVAHAPTIPTAHLEQLRPAVEGGPHRQAARRPSPYSQPVGACVLVLQWQQEATARQPSRMLSRLTKRRAGWGGAGRAGRQPLAASILHALYDLGTKQHQWDNTKSNAPLHFLNPPPQTPHAPKEAPSPPPPPPHTHLDEELRRRRQVVKGVVLGQQPPLLVPVAPQLAAAAHVGNGADESAVQQAQLGAWPRRGPGGEGEAACWKAQIKDNFLVAAQPRLPAANSCTQLFPSLHLVPPTQLPAPPCLPLPLTTFPHTGTQAD
jgi:hypothetical protein